MEQPHVYIYKTILLHSASNCQKKPIYEGLGNRMTSVPTYSVYTYPTTVLTPFFRLNIFFIDAQVQHFLGPSLIIYVYVHVYFSMTILYTYLFTCDCSLISLNRRPVPLSHLVASSQEVKCQTSQTK